MGRVEQYPPGTFCWIDLGTTEMPDARRFYPSLFGWELVDIDSAGAPYTIARLADGDVCGLRLPARDDAGGWLSYIAVDDVAMAAARAIGLGADVLGEIRVTPGATRVIALRDPVGAVVGLWRSSDLPGAHVVNEVGTWTWTELVTDDLDRASAFYGELLGWEAQSTPDGSGRLAFRMGELLIGGAHRPFPGEAPDPRWDVSFRVDDVHRAVDRVEELGGYVIFPPMEIPMGRFTIVTDNAGVPMTLTEFGRVVGSVAQA